MSEEQKKLTSGRELQGEGSLEESAGIGQLVSSRADFLQGRNSSSAKLSSMPLAVLLPSISGSGGLGELPQYVDFFKEQLSVLHSDASRFDVDEDGEKRKKRAAEESMLNQVLQWLSLS